MKKNPSLEKFNDKYNGMDQERPIPFTARLMAYYRAQESESKDGLIIDPYAKHLAGDLTEYFKDHGRYSKIDYGIVRSYYIEENLLKPWCFERNESQIVLLGAGLDTRAYRFTPLSKNLHTLFEIDLPELMEYKKEILKKEKPLCSLIRISENLSNINWIDKLVQYGYKKDIPTFWVLEGVMYYLEKHEASLILQKISKISSKKSQIFTDLCVPVYAEVKFGPFSKHFKWGIKKEATANYFKENGWKVSVDWADNHDLGRDVGQKGLFFICGEKLF